jgi:hypothetical protein
VTVEESLRHVHDAGDRWRRHCGRSTIPPVREALWLPWVALVILPRAPRLIASLSSFLKEVGGPRPLINVMRTPRRAPRLKAMLLP